MQVHLFEASGNLLGPMSKDSQKRAVEYLDKFGVNIHLNTAVKSYTKGQLVYGEDESLMTETVIWTAGVKGAYLPGLPQDVYLPNSRIKVNEFNEIGGLADVYAIGDIASMSLEDFPRGHPMVAPVAIQQGELLAKNIMKKINNAPLEAFKYFDKGSMATVGRNKAVVDFPGGKIKLGGFFAFMAWMFVHLMSLVGFRNKLIVLTGWLYNYMNYDRVLRLIIRPSKTRNTNI